MSEISTVQIIIMMAVPLVLAIVLHEVAHGFMAYMKGDSTAASLGRLSLNPLTHIDPFGTVVLPILFFLSTGFIFAYAKPVPVNFAALNRPKEDMVWVAAAGPGTNLLLAMISALILRLSGFAFPEVRAYLAFIEQGIMPPGASTILFPIVGMLYFSVVLNVVLMIINLIPVPPADGGRIVTGLLPHEQAAAYSKIEPYGLIILIVIIMMNPLGITHKVIWPLIIGIVDLLI